MKVAFRYILFLCLAVMPPAELYAAVNISASVVDGGSTLKLGKLEGSLEKDKAVRIRVNTDDGRQYQIYQRMVDPLVNQQGDFLNQQVLETYTLNGSNASGTLYAQAREMLGSSDQLVYTSTPDGQSDTVTLVYLVNQERISSAGNYIGRIQYTVRSLGAGSQDQAILNVTLDAASSFTCSVKGIRSADRLQLSSSGSFGQEDGLKIEYEGNDDQSVRIYQEYQIIPQNENGTVITEQAIKIFMTGDGLRNIVTTPDGINSKRTLLYQSKEPSDQWVYHLGLNDVVMDQLQSGIYHGRLLITIESNSGVREFALSVEVDIKPLFDIEVVLPDQGVRFAKVLPTDPPQVKEVLVKVRSNLGKPYMVTQNVASSLVTPKGDQIKDEFFVFKTELVGSAKGRSDRPDFAPVGVGEKPIFYSDRTGASAEFKVYYRLSSYPEITAGDYGVPIVFSLGEM